jgi:hypothetical protein
MFGWLLVRVTYVVALLVGVEFFGLLSREEGVHSALYPVWHVRLLLLALTAIVVHLDRKRAHEHLLQANLGVPAVWFPATSLVAAGLSDLAVQTLMSTI